MLTANTLLLLIKVSLEQQTYLSQATGFHRLQTLAAVRRSPGSRKLKTFNNSSSGKLKYQKNDSKGQVPYYKMMLIRKYLLQNASNMHIYTARGLT